MHSFAVDCENVSNEDKFAVVVQLASVEKHDLKQCWLKALYFVCYVSDERLRRSELG